MSQNDNPAEPFKKALADATRVLADDPDIAVSYSVDPPGMTPDSMRLPQVSRRLSKAEDGRRLRASPPVSQRNHPCAV